MKPILLLLTATLLLSNFSLLVDAATPLQIFLLAGQSNMVGMGSLEHLDLLVHNNNSRNEYRDALWNGTGYKICHNVVVKFEARHGYLTAGPDSGFAAPGHFGPELMFGWTLGEHFSNETILLIKTAYGGRSLAVDFRPPASGEPSYGHEHPSHFGWEYRQMITDILDTLGKLSRIIPGYTNEQGYVLSGFVWFQGWNDMLNWPTVNEYGFNLANLIRDVRLDLDAPSLPVIVGELGMHGVDPGKGRWVPRVSAMRAHQHSVTLLPEFRNNTLFVRTAPYAVSNGTHYNGGYHYFGRADTYFHIGQAFGRGMIELTENETASTDHDVSMIDMMQQGANLFAGILARLHRTQLR